MRSPPARRSRKFNHCWLNLAPRRWGFYIKSRSTNYPNHCHHGDPPPTRKIPTVEPGIEPRTSWLVVRSSDHYSTRLVSTSNTTFYWPTLMHHLMYTRSHINYSSKSFRCSPTPSSRSPFNCKFFETRQMTMGICCPHFIRSQFSTHNAQLA